MLPSNPNTLVKGGVSMKEPYEKPEMATEEVDVQMLVAQGGSPLPMMAAAPSLQLCPVDQK